MERSKLDRTVARVATKYGRIRLKIGLLDGEMLKASPEYEDCRSAAEKHGVTLAKVAEAAREAWKKGGRKSR
ncbi:MAG TPA: nickel insertion protein, partial [Planctomycetota bacterium]|nr:nickel insertion protein [Planctomycetota bacterium]